MSLRALRILPMVCLLAAAGAPARAQQKGRTAASEESLLLGLSKLNLGTISSLEEKRQFLTTVQLEKQKIQQHMLEGVYENALELYRHGKYEQAQELAGKILAIDPDFQDAKLVMQVSGQLQGAPRGRGAEKTAMEDRFAAALALYREGHLVEAVRKWEEVVKLSPGNMKAAYWLKKARGEMVDEYIARGDKASAEKNLRGALDQWYNAILISKNDPRLVAKISRAENDLRHQEAMRSLQRALALYGEGNLADSYTALKGVLEFEPGDYKAQKMFGEIRYEIAGRYIGDGKKAYASRLYTQAISSWNRAKEWGYDAGYVGQLVARAREQMRREEEDRKRETERTRREAAEALERPKKEQEESAKKEIQTQLGDQSAVQLPANTPPAISTENKSAALQRYQNGIKYYQDGDYEKARVEWQLAKQLDPGNLDVDAGLRRLDQMLGAGQ